MHTFSLWLEDNVKRQSRDTMKYCIMWTTTAGRWMAELPKSEKNIYELSWTFRVKCLCSWMRLCGLSLSNSTLFFCLKTQLRNKIIYTTKQNQKDCPSPTFMLVFIHDSGPSFASHKRHLTREGICWADPGPAPSAISPKYEKMEGRFRF